MDITKYLNDFLAKVQAVDLATIKPPESVKEEGDVVLGVSPDELKKL